MPPWVDEEFFYHPFDLETPPLAENGLEVLQELQGTTTGFGAAVDCVEMSSNAENDTLQFQVNQNGSSIQFSTSHFFPNGTSVTCFYPRSASHTANDTTNDIFPFPNGNLALEVMQTMQPAAGVDDGGFCSSIIVAGWVRAIDNESSSGKNNTTASGRDITSTFLSCSATLRTAQFDVAVDSTGHLIRSQRTSDFAGDTGPYFLGNASEVGLFQHSSALIAALNPGDFEWHNDSFTSDWVNSLLASIRNSSSLVDPSAPVPNATAVAPLLESLYEQLFAILLGLNTNIFPEARPPTPMTAQALVLEPRLFVSPLMFTISMTILCLQLVVAILYYANRPKRFLPRMPTSIGSIIAFVSASRALEDFGPEKEKDGENEERRYGYGRLVGTDGRTRVGIEKQRYVVPLKSQNPDVKKRRRWAWGRGKKDENEIKTWI